jgi:hypothetical protein
MSYRSTPQFKNFAGVLRKYDPQQWSDLLAMGATQPFPFLVDINPKAILPPIAAAKVPGQLTAQLPPAHDPDNSQICPFGRE